MLGSVQFHVVPAAEAGRQVLGAEGGKRVEADSRAWGPQVRGGWDEGILRHQDPPARLPPAQSRSAGARSAPGPHRCHHHHNPESPDGIRTPRW